MSNLAKEKEGIQVCSHLEEICRVKDRLDTVQVQAIKILFLQVLCNVLSLLDNQVLGDVAGQLIFLSLSETLLECVGTLLDVLLVQTQILVNKEHFRHRSRQSLESCVKVLTPFWVFPRGNSLRTKYNL